MILRNYHTHTTYCDGKDTPEEMILAAIDKGLRTLGFSGHSPLFSEDWCMTKESVREYYEELTSLKEKYKDKIEILIGLEQDILSEEPELPFDYIIGSVHALPVKGGLVPVDESLEMLERDINKHFGGDSLLFAKKYFERVAKVFDRTGCQIVGHIDLLTKFQQIKPLFDTANKRYLRYAKKAIKKLSSQGVIFEVNTGAMARGYRTLPYPEKELLKLIKAYDGKVMINSDCHDKNFLTCGFEDALSLLRECGFTQVFYLSKGKILSEEI